MRTGRISKNSKLYSYSRSGSLDDGIIGFHFLEGQLAEGAFIRITIGRVDDSRVHHLVIESL